jgi:hypothetical protein
MKTHAFGRLSKFFSYIVSYIKRKLFLRSIVGQGQQYLVCSCWVEAKKPLRLDVKLTFRGSVVTSALSEICFKFMLSLRGRIQSDLRQTVLLLCNYFHHSFHRMASLDVHLWVHLLHNTFWSMTASLDLLRNKLLIICYRKINILDSLGSSTQQCDR